MALTGNSSSLQDGCKSVASVDTTSILGFAEESRAAPRRNPSPMLPSSSAGGAERFVEDSFAEIKRTVSAMARRGGRLHRVKSYRFQKYRHIGENHAGQEDERIGREESAALRVGAPPRSPRSPPPSFSSFSPPSSPSSPARLRDATGKSSDEIRGRGGGVGKPKASPPRQLAPSRPPPHDGGARADDGSRRLDLDLDLALFTATKLSRASTAALVAARSHDRAGVVAASSTNGGGDWAAAEAHFTLAVEALTEQLRAVEADADADAEEGAPPSPTGGSKAKGASAEIAPLVRSLPLSRPREVRARAEGGGAGGAGGSAVPLTASPPSRTAGDEAACQRSPLLLLLRELLVQVLARRATAWHRLQAHDAAADDCFAALAHIDKAAAAAASARASPERKRRGGGGGAAGAAAALAGAAAAPAATKAAAVPLEFRAMAATCCRLLGECLLAKGYVRSQSTPPLRQRVSPKSFVLRGVLCICLFPHLFPIAIDS